MLQTMKLVEFHLDFRVLSLIFSYNSDNFPETGNES